MAFGKEIKRLRELDGVSAESMVKILGIESVERYKNWEKRDSNPKHDDAMKIQGVLGVSIDDLAKLEKLPTGLIDKKSYIEQRRELKQKGTIDSEGIAFVPISAQSGYSKHYIDPLYLEQLEKVFIPGFPYKGNQFRIFEVNGESMEPTFKEGYYLICETVDKDYWVHIADYYAYVIVTEDQVLLKRIAKKDESNWALMSDNEDYFPQIKMPVEKVKELWLVKRKIDWEMSPPKRFEIKV